MGTKDRYQTELVTRCAPRWAWEVIDDALDLGTVERIPTAEERVSTREALIAMIDACERAE